VNTFRDGELTDLEYGLGLLRVESPPGMNSNPPFGPILDSTARVNPGPSGPDG